MGTVLFALGILVSLTLHEVGHALSARWFGMRVTRFFVGWGPTVFSFRRRGIEYGVKALPVGAFVKITGMIRGVDEDGPEAMWRHPVWKRTVVMSAGSLVHFGLGLFVLWGLFAFTPLPDENALQTSPVRVAEVTPASAAVRAGLRPGDVITALGPHAVHGWNDLTTVIRAGGGRPVRISYVRDGVAGTATVTLPVVSGVGVLGISPVTPTSVAGPVAAVGLAGHQAAAIVTGSVTALTGVPAKIPALWRSLTGGPRDPDTPISMVGASRIGGELYDHGQTATFLMLLASLNFFIGLFNLLPLPPADGGHIAVIWFERARALLYRRIGRRDPGHVDYLKLAPITLTAVALFAGYTLLTVTADIVNPIKIF